MVIDSSDFTFQLPQGRRFNPTVKNDWLTGNICDLVSELKKEDLLNLVKGKLYIRAVFHQTDEPATELSTGDKRGRSGSPDEGNGKQFQVNITHVS